MKNKKSRYLVVLDSSKQTGILLKIDARHLVIDPQRESMEFFYDFGRFCEKEKCSVYFRMNGFSRIREEKKKVIWRRKKQLDQRGLPVYFQMVPVLDV